MSEVRDVWVDACMRRYQMIMTWCIGDLIGYALYKVVNNIQEQAIKLNIYCIIFYKLSLSVTSNSQAASKIHQIPFYSI